MKSLIILMLLLGNLVNSQTLYTYYTDKYCLDRKPFNKDSIKCDESGKSEGTIAIDETNGIIYLTGKYHSIGYKIYRFYGDSEKPGVFYYHVRSEDGVEAVIGTDYTHKFFIWRFANSIVRYYVYKEEINVND